MPKKPVVATGEELEQAVAELKGTFDLPDSSGSMEGAYSILVFGGKGFLQQVVMTWEDGDAYSEDIVERIVKTLEVKTTV